MKPTERSYPCGICGKSHRSSLMIFSRHTKRHYCRRHLLKDRVKGAA